MNTVQNTLIKELEKHGIKIDPTAKQLKIEQTLYFSSFTELALMHDSLSVLITECGNSISDNMTFSETNHIGNAIAYIGQLQQKLNILNISDTLDRLMFSE